MPARRLSKAARILSEPPTAPAAFEPWFRDSDKLLQAVLERARQDSMFARRVVDEVAQWVKHDTRLKTALRAGLMAPSRGRRSTPRHMHAHLLADLELVRSAKGWSEEQAVPWLADRWNLSEDGLRSRLKAAKNAVPRD